MKVSNLFFSVNLLVKYVKNPFQGFLGFIGFKNKVNVKLKHDLGNFMYFPNKDKNRLGYLLGILDQIDLDNTQDVLNFQYYIRQIDEDIIELHGIKFVNEECGILGESLIENPYDVVDVKNRIIVDIGANIGDSTLMFANNGAKEVFGFEPITPIYNIALKNVDLNPILKNKIHLYNKAVSGESGVLKVYFENGHSSGANSFVDENCECCEIESITMEQLINEYGVIPDILKIDCEGCEYDIVDKSDLSMFNDIIIEYHQLLRGIPKEYLIKKLKIMGFSIVEYPVFNISPDEMGIIHAKKRRGQKSC